MSVFFVLGGGVLLALSCIDIRTKKIPIAMVGLLFAAMLGLFMCSEQADQSMAHKVVSLLTGLLPGGIGLLLSYVTRGRFGAGDAVILLALGIGFGLYKTMLLWITALGIAALLAILLLALKKAERKTELPFVPCLFLSYALCGGISF